MLIGFRCLSVMVAAGAIILGVSGDAKAYQDPDPCPCQRDNAVMVAPSDAAETTRRISLMLSGDTPPRHPRLAIMPSALEEARKTLPLAEGCGRIRLVTSNVTDVHFTAFSPGPAGRREDWSVIVRGRAERMGCSSVGVVVHVNMVIPYPTGSGDRIARVDGFAFNPIANQQGR